MVKDDSTLYALFCTEPEYLFDMDLLGGLTKERKIEDALAITISISFCIVNKRLCQCLASNNFPSLAKCVEEYRRTSKNVDKTEAEKPSTDNEVRISHSKIPVYVDTCLKLLQKDNKTHIVVVGKGQFVNKAVTVIEMVKRKMQGTLHQYTQIGSVSVIEQWDAINDEKLDSVQVNKKVPVIIIYLSLNEMSELEATSGHQAPTGPDIYA
ncbi:hypothetical protein [Parasitella parasitica]|uniref:DNA/RNA-binding protein Alba-like domain-containing protein n=1 Tax=Parasitella parasitica TaxID=35722 RepID=A0A0B7N1T6_9FUNG|nr:hypothetical protein [Parasitella parasitica]